jgi:hypothetical protein
MNKTEAMIWSVLQRPMMYTVNGAYGEVVAFLTGYYSGAALGHPHEPSVRIWGDFSLFVRNSLQISGSNVFGTFQDIHGVVSLEALKAKYEEFAKARELGHLID